MGVIFDRSVLDAIFEKKYNILEYLIPFFQVDSPPETQRRAGRPERAA